MTAVRSSTLAVATVALAASASLLPARGGGRAPSHATGIRVGLVFDVGGRGDKSFNDAAYAGLEKAERELGIRAEVLEPSGAEDREAAMRLFASRGFDLVIGVGFIFSTDLNVVARGFPKTRFACIDYVPPADGAIPGNVAGLAFREEQGAFLVGAVAGLESRSHHVGFVGGMDIPLIHKFEAGYGAGVHAVCPACVVHVAYAGVTPDAFRDPAKGKALAISQIAAGADVVFHASGTTGQGVFEAARQMQARAIGVDADQYDEMPGVVMTSLVKRGDVAVFDTIRDVAAGRFVSGMHVFGLAEEGIDYVHDGPHAASIAEATKQRVEQLRAQIVAGEIRVPSR
jgi:basic membrane protein A